MVSLSLWRSAREAMGVSPYVALHGWPLLHVLRPMAGHSCLLSDDRTSGILAHYACSLPAVVVTAAEGSAAIVISIRSSDDAEQASVPVFRCDWGRYAFARGSRDRPQAGPR